MEEENMDVHGKLKWSSEQFRRLEEELYAAFSKLFNEKAELEISNEETEQTIFFIREQLENGNSSLPEVDGYPEQ
ncbi:hypothetical protein RHSIM_Rhsim11G0140200 [Rhododendron simsii]|uniref:Uncharacterized protein n=1 Tax=Rhododendron simsii TaxID=118357 RepID=A0A834GDI7_RHOSS|nr:hypothetical protein RHSIM_Rhsim11G0140200 [Rhododendron simsii]